MKTRHLLVLLALPCSLAKARAQFDLRAGTVGLPDDDPGNPFVHQYHPDYDNKNARFQLVDTGVESFDGGRVQTLTFSYSSPQGESSLGWGSLAVMGNYSEALAGNHK